MHGIEAQMVLDQHPSATEKRSKLLLACLEVGTRPSPRRPVRALHNPIPTSTHPPPRPAPPPPDLETRSAAPCRRAPPDPPPDVSL
jgi:hypothetical protein